MALSQSQKSMLQKARALGGGQPRVQLTDHQCAFLLVTVARDIGCADVLADVSPDMPSFFGPEALDGVPEIDADVEALFGALVVANADADTYFSCLAKLYRARLKYHRILACQSIPTMDQVGPRGLLQYGCIPPTALTGLLLWRTWMYDIDNRAGQETGYLFEPIIAHAIGGLPVAAGKSPVRRTGRPDKGRQVDCLRGTSAYEVKVRVTIAASGQGRWQEELEFAEDCRHSGYTPVLVVLDPTPNPKLGELRQAFVDAGGEVHIGDGAWRHLYAQAGPTMRLFLSKYVREPIDSLTAIAEEPLPMLALAAESGEIVVTIGDEQLRILREAAKCESEEAALPDDVDEELPG